METTPIAHVSVSLSPWTMFAGLGSVGVGLIYVALKSFFVRGGGLRTLVTAVQNRPSSIGVIVVIDAAAGLVLGCAAVVGGVSSPTWLVHWTTAYPPFGWAVIGVFGPAVSDRALSGSFVRGRFEPYLATPELSDEELRRAADVRSISDSAWRLRNESVHAIENEVWILVQRTLTEESLRLGDRFEELLTSDLRRARELPRITRDFGKRERLPEAVLDAAARLTPECSDESAVDLLDALASELINAQLWDPLEVILGSPPQRRRRRR